MHSRGKYAIIQTNFKSDAFEENKGQQQFVRESAVGVSPAARLSGPLSERPVRSRGPVPCIVPARGWTFMFGNLGGNAEFFVP